MAKMGRPQKPYQTTSGECIGGLYQLPDGRWRINATKKTFTEPDERKAVARFRQLTRQAEPPVEIPFAEGGAGSPALAESAQQAGSEPQFGIRVADDGTIALSRFVPSAELWAWLRDELATSPEYVAKMTGIPELAGLRNLAIPKPSPKLCDIIENYRSHGASTDKAKREAIKPLGRLVKQSGAKTLDDLTTDALLAFKREIEKTVPGPATRRAYYARIKAVIGFGLKTGMDAAPIRACLDRCKVLWTAEAMPSVNPQPISREHFHKLLDAGNGTWRAWLLCGLNLCLHMEEVCGLRWADFDLANGTYACVRNKTRRKRIPRAATLWPETIAALKAIKRTDNPYVFISTHGTRYNKNTRVNDFRDLRIKAKLPESVTFDAIRDGAYTAASHGTTDGRLARLLAGHRAPGLEDNYVLRNPEIVRPACDAVHRAYLGGS